MISISNFFDDRETDGDITEQKTFSPHARTTIHRYLKLADHDDLAKERGI